LAKSRRHTYTFILDEMNLANMETLSLDSDNDTELNYAETDSYVSTPLKPKQLTPVRLRDHLFKTTEKRDDDQHEEGTLDTVR
jgi:hypothetical protein